MRGIRKHTGTLLLLLFVSYYGGITLFRHAHQLGENTIVHSHPYSGSCEHTHSAGELRFIQQLSLFLSLAVAGVVFLFKRSILVITLFFPGTVSRPVQNIPNANALRGPPEADGYSL